MQMVVPKEFTHLKPFIASISQHGPVTTVPLPHLVHSVHAGWQQQAAIPSSTVPVDIKVDRAAYAPYS